MFTGNPAGVVPLESWLEDEVLQNIASENNVAATAFFKQGSSDQKYELRWFTPTAEIPLCAHGSIAAAWVICEGLKWETSKFVFETLSGDLAIQRLSSGEFKMDFPIDPYEETDIDPTVASALGQKPSRLLRARYSVAVYDRESDIINLRPNINKIANCCHAKRPGAVVITAPADPGKDYDFVSRFFAPGVGVDEDPVTGSAHCILSKFWADELGRESVMGYQVSSRGGFIHCHVNGDRVAFTGRATPYSIGNIIGLD